MKAALEIPADTRDSIERARKALNRAFLGDLYEHKKACKHGLVTRWVRGKKVCEEGQYKITQHCTICGELRDYIIEYSPREGQTRKGKLAPEEGADGGEREQEAQRA